ncbi:MAG: hypothetical protein OJF49_003626 [Ktedonobacterales bacterium]|jgi:lysyl-tRNA synthetase class II|nr:MAG: hypothetical protein OJF49_003626 [Ktedonobacterales bacterium]
MKYTIELPDDVAARLRQLAEERHQTPEDMIAGLVDHEVATTTTAPQATRDNPLGVNPLAKYVGQFTADVPDITQRHDYYIAEEAMGARDDGQ